MATIILLGTSPSTPQAPRLLDQVRQMAMARFGRPEPAERYVQWSRRYILFHGKRHPRELGRAEVGRFLEQVVQSEKDPLGCLEAAREALGFLYEEVLQAPLGELPYPEPPKLMDRLRRAIRLRRNIGSASVRAATKPARKCIRLGFGSGSSICRSAAMRSS